MNESGRQNCKRQVKQAKVYFLSGTRLKKKELTIAFEQLWVLITWDCDVGILSALGCKKNYKKN